MNWKHSSLVWPDVAQTIQTRGESVINQLEAEMTQALTRLTQLTDEADFKRHPLSVEAEKALDLRDELEKLRASGTVLTVSPYVFKMGNDDAMAHYLNPEQAIETLVLKLRDGVDKNGPSGELYCIAILISANTLTDFSAQLNQVMRVFPLPDWAQVARQTTALIALEADKLHQPPPVSLPRFKPASHINANPLRELVKQQGTQIATLESLAGDKNNVADKLRALASKKREKLMAVSETINGLKVLQGSVWSLPLTGCASGLASQLSKASIPNNHKHCVASILLSAQPLTFLEGLLCSA